MKVVLKPGHRLQLLEGGRELFAAMVQAIERAERWVWVETYILSFENDVEQVLHALEQAALRGLQVRFMVDGLGTPRVDAKWLERLDQAGVLWHWYRPLGRVGYLLPSRWRRLHRKLCLVDGVVGYCGGINLIDDLDDVSLGRLSQPRLDFALEVRGPLLQDMQRAMDVLWRRSRVINDVRRLALTHVLDDWRKTPTAPMPTHDPQTTAHAALVLRDNVGHRHDIERTYLKAIGEARHHIIIANAYFIPGRRLRRALILAVQRGVRVQLLVQGKYESFLQFHAARPVHARLLRAGVHIHEYAPSALHAKVAVMDARWATVGSTNLDPISLLLAREANVVTTDAAFAQQLHQRLTRLIEEDGVALDAQVLAARPWVERWQDLLAFGVMRTLLFLTGYRY